MSAITPNPPRWHPSPDPLAIPVPGVDSNASLNDQIDQIDQLIIIKLQTIDANFSKIQNVMATKLLPAVKRYAVASEPVREAAKFWTSFYEKAAQVHIPTSDDYSSLHDHPQHASESFHSNSFPNQSPSPPDIENDTTPSQSPSRTRDLPESSFTPSNAVSSTPARLSLHNLTVDNPPSWSASLESPLVRLDRELQKFILEQGTEAFPPPDTVYPPPPTQQSHHPSPIFDQFNDSFDDSAELMRGLSPPQTVAFARAPRSSMGLGILPPLGRTPAKASRPTLAKTPGKEAAERIRRDLLGDVQSEHNTMSEIPTPPSITRYIRHAYPSTYNGPTSSTMRKQQSLHTPGQHQDEEPSTLQPGGRRPDSDSDSDSLGETRYPGQPSTAFLMAAARNPDPDDSFGSSNSNHSSDSIRNDFDNEGAAVHPFARAMEAGEDAFDDTFDSADGDDSGVQEETVFGIPPAQRQHWRGPGELKLLGDDLLQDTIGIGSQLAKAGRVEESPTPFGRG